MTIAGPGGTKNFFSDPPSGTVFALGSLVDVGPLQWPGGRLKREILRCYTFLPICLFPPKLRVGHVLREIFFSEPNQETFHRMM